MNLLDQLTRIRHFLRDPSKKIWSDDYLTKLFNDVQEDLQNQTKILFDLVSIRIPPVYHMSYMYDWEWQYLPTNYTQFYQCLTYWQQSDIVHTNDWEIQSIWYGSVSYADLGNRFTHPWESMMGTPGEEMKVRFPSNFRSARHISYDRRPITYAPKSEIMDINPSYKTYTGTPQYYYRDELDNSFVLYPRPEDSNWADGEGNSLFTDTDATDSETGVILRKPDSTLSSSYGVAVDVLEADNNVILFYEINPTNLSAYIDESDFPIYMRKYIEYGVLSRAYGANTDGRIPSLERYWSSRYDLGVRILKKYANLRYRDRVYKLRTKAATPYHGRKHPRLPSTYPDVF